MIAVSISAADVSGVRPSQHVEHGVITSSGTLNGAMRGRSMQ
jgi:hypothetical protein